MVIFGIWDGVLILLLILNCVTDIVNVLLLAYTVWAPVHAVNHAIHLHLPQR
jgi:fumarate reductase subunit D